MRFLLQATPYTLQQPAAAGPAPYSAYQPAGVAGMVPLNQRGIYDQYHAYLDKLQDRNSRERDSPVAPFGKLLAVEVVVVVLLAAWFAYLSSANKHFLIHCRTPIW